MTQAALVALDEPKIANRQGLGNKKRDEILALRRALIETGVEADAPTSRERPPLFPDAHRLGLGAAITRSLQRVGFTTVGRLTDAPRDDLRPVSGVGPKTIAQIVQALQRISDSAAGVADAQTLDAAWERTTAPLQGQQELILERLFGIYRRLATQVELVDEIGMAQPAISLDRQRTLAILDRRALSDIVDHTDGMLISAGGLLRVDEAAERLLERWPAIGDFGVSGFLRVIAEIEPLRFARHAVLDDEPNDVHARPLYAVDTIAAFLHAARENAKWPPQRPEATRAILQSYLPEYPHDPLGLAVRLTRDLRLTDEGEIYEAPVTLEQVVRHVLHKSRPPILVAELAERIASSFGEAVIPLADPEALVRVVSSLASYRYDPSKQEIDVRRSQSIEANPHVVVDPLPAELLVRDPAKAARDVLRVSSQRDGFRLVVEAHEVQPEVARSVARALDGATFISFDDAFFRGVDAQIDAFDHAERFLAQRPKLRQKAVQVLDQLVKQHGQGGRRILLDDAALLGVCDALHLVRRIYDLTATGGRGFWAVEIPGIVHQRQPLFNEKAGALVFTIEGATLPLTRELPALAAA